MSHSTCCTTLPFNVSVIGPLYDPSLIRYIPLVFIPFKSSPYTPFCTTKTFNSSPKNRKSRLCCCYSYPIKPFAPPKHSHFYSSRIVVYINLKTNRSVFIKPDHKLPIPNYIWNDCRGSNIKPRDSYRIKLIRCSYVPSIP